MARKTPELTLHPRGSGDVQAIEKKVDDDRIIALAAGLLRAMDPHTGRTVVAETLIAPSRDIPKFTAERAQREAALILESRARAQESLGEVSVADIVTVHTPETVVDQREAA